ncbi:MAG TPA: 1-(5-phosphoribosyl)-5-[(5-phosphoribosylamino)methylideneamino]imidazole-4-carboxamide isomerase [Saprospiraceae bacterium]|nr:1-(5-phosphoribosyl)-5-[(5-phosphoribosylamino)methylideneamino]imidazole-4-carboxamide isomerase [Saprospiraceae bacterium]
MQTKPPNIYPAIDIIDGKCVRLTKGNYDTKVVYDDDPLRMAQYFKSKGADYIHIVDLDAAKNPANHNRELIAAIITQSGLKVQTGGGIRTEADVETLLTLGAHRVIIGSAAVHRREEVFQWIKKYGADRIVIGADVVDQKIATHGWQQVTDEDIFDFINSYKAQGATTFLCTDIAKDGMLAGSSRPLYKEILQGFPHVQLIASGGVHDMDEVGRLQQMGMESIIIGKAIYEGKINIDDLFAKS